MSAGGGERPLVRLRFSPSAATLPSSLPMFATFHCIRKRAPTIRRIHPAGTALLAWPECPTPTGCGILRPPLSDLSLLTWVELGRSRPAWSGDRFRRVSPAAWRPREGPLTEPIAAAQPRPQQRVLMPLTGPCPRERAMTRSGRAGIYAMAAGRGVVADRCRLAADCATRHALGNRSAGGTS